MKKIVLLGCLLLLLLTGCGKTESKPFVVGFTDYPPMGFKDTDGNFVGFDIDLAKEVFKRLDREVEFQYINWDSKTMELNSGSIDAIWNGFTVTEERKEEVLFTNSYLNNAIVIITRKGDNQITSTDDLKGKYLAVESESSGQHVLEDLFDVNQDVTLNRFTSINEALLDLAAGNSDAVVADEIYGRYLIKQSDDYQVVPNVRLNSEEYAIGLRKDDTEMAETINTTIQEIIDDGTAAQISIKWFGEDIIKP